MNQEAEGSLAKKPLAAPVRVEQLAALYEDPSVLSARWDRLNRDIKNAHRVVLSTHENPDGDGLGSQLGFCEHLKSLDKDCRVINWSPVPLIYRFLDPNSWLEEYDSDRDGDWLKGCDLAIVFDLGDFRRTRGLGEALVALGIPITSIDHHVQSGADEEGTTPFVNLILDGGASSTGALVWEYLKLHRSEPLTPTMATALYTALITDTGSFSYSNTDERAHLMAIDILRTGIEPYEVSKRVFEQRERSQVRLMGALIEGLAFAAGGQVAWCAITQAALTKADATLHDLDGFSDFLRSIKGVEIAALVSEVEPGVTKINLRSKGKVSINDVAHAFGGGGHALASGAIVDRPWRDVADELLARLGAKLGQTNQAEKGEASGG